MSEQKHYDIYFGITQKEAIALAKALRQYNQSTKKKSEKFMCDDLLDLLKLQVNGQGGSL